MTSRRAFLAAFICGLPVKARAKSGAIPPPKGEIILEVEGAIHQKNSGEKAIFDIEMLDSLPQASFRTTTIWTEGIAEFSGPPLRSLLDWLEAEALEITINAVNDYSVTLSPNTINEYFPILATRMNEVPLNIRNFGPIWLIYPYDSPTEYQNNIIYSQSIWQLTNISISSK
jgi:hypothetical protein